jgi:hypothetical protein
MDFLRYTEKRLLASSCLSVCLHETTQLPLYELHEIWYFIFRENSSFIKIGEEKNGTLHEDIYTYFIISSLILLRTKNVSGKRCKENQNTHLMSCDFFKNHSVDNIMWKIIVELGMSQMAIWPIPIACWIPKATNTHSGYVMLITFALQ